MSHNDTQSLVSIVVPAYNEEAVIGELHQRLTQVLQTNGVAYEVIYVDDGSRDRTFDLLSQLRQQDPCIGLVKLSRNFGKEIALSAGLQAVRGDCAIVIDADLQDPPELIPAMIEAWRAGADMVNMRRRSRAGETEFKRWSAHMFYRVLNQLSDVSIPEDVGDFRLISRRALDALNQLPESNRYMKGLFAWVGFNQVTLDYDRDARFAGEVKQNYFKLWALAVEGITSFSVKPLRLASLMGVLISSISFLLMIFYALKTMMYGESVKGFPTLIVALFFLGGIQLLGIGLLGEYLGRMFIESKRRPLYFVDQAQFTDVMTLKQIAQSHEA
jgi:glycosyltransferase involved in cell wall biosynthesis